MPNLVTLIYVCLKSDIKKNILKEVAEFLQLEMLNQDQAQKKVNWFQKVREYQGN